MPKAHLHTHKRKCTALTTVENQSSVTVGNLLWAIKDTTNSHKNGQLIPSVTDVTIEGSLVIVHKPDIAKPDKAGHGTLTTKTAEGFADVTVYGY